MRVSNEKERLQKGISTNAQQNAHSRLTPCLPYFFAYFLAYFFPPFLLALQAFNPSFTPSFALSLAPSHALPLLSTT